MRTLTKRNKRPVNDRVHRDGDADRVLPRFLRRPARIASRLFTGDIKIPRYTEAFGIAAIFGAVALYGSIIGGQFATGVEAVTRNIGLSVAEIDIEGHVHALPEDLFAAIGLTGERSLFSINPDQAKQALVSLPWISDAEVRKVYPGKLIVKVTEKQPFAVWQTGSVLNVVQHDGDVIDQYTGTFLQALPLLVGEGAPKKASEIIKLVASFPTIMPEIHAYVRVGERRWDLRLRNGVTIKLPANDPESALIRLSDMQANFNVMARDVDFIDLRLSDRTVFALREDALATRKASLKEQGIKIERDGGAI